MTIVIDLLRAGLLASEVVLGVLVSYLLLLTAAALCARKETEPRPGRPSSRFAIMVPAHNEERLLPELLDNLGRLDYPRELYTVFVVADNCSDRTAEIGRAYGAVVFERFSETEQGKGYALEWLLGKIVERGEPHDAVVILDADTVVSATFLRVMDARLARGERAIQAYYAVRDPDAAWSSALRSVALTVLHYLRPQGRMVLGGSTGLKGNGMVFAADIVREHRWTNSLTEDIEYHMALILAGERVTFAPDAVVWAEMPNTLRASDSQNARWERGRIEMLRRFVPRLLREALRRRSFLLFDAAMEQIIPPFSVLAGGSALALAAAVALRSKLGVALGVGLVGGQVVYVLTGLRLAGASARTYRSLMYAPVLMIWKLLLYVRVLTGLGPKGWVRTARNESGGG